MTCPFLFVRHGHRVNNSKRSPALGHSSSSQSHYNTKMKWNPWCGLVIFRKCRSLRPWRSVSVDFPLGRDNINTGKIIAVSDDGRWRPHRPFSRRFPFPSIYSLLLSICLCVMFVYKQSIHNGQTAVRPACSVWESACVCVVCGCAIDPMETARPF